MPQLQKHSANIREMVSMFERSVVPPFRMEPLPGEQVMWVGSAAGAGLRITGPDLARKKMLDILNAIQFSELDRVLGREDELHYVVRSYDVYKLVRHSLDDMRALDLKCVGGKATVRLLLRECRNEFDRLTKAVWILSVTARFGIWAEKKAQQFRAWRARAT